eukprot:3215317-Prymnesium_polylepis.1
MAPPPPPYFMPMMPVAMAADSCGTMRPMATAAGTGCANANPNLRAPATAFLRLLLPRGTRHPAVDATRTRIAPHIRRPPPR